MPFAITIVLGAFLLFQVQPIVAKIILPVFGGGAAVWTGCLLFFQFFLLLGYLYAHVLTRYCNFKTQLRLHSILVLFSLIFLPITLNTSLPAQVSPLYGILVLLSMSIGGPYLLLSSTGPLLQRWLSMVDEEKIPFKLYSLSNAASLLALLSFPFVIEPLLDREQQTLTWSCGYIAYMLVLLMLIYKLSRQEITDTLNVKDKQESAKVGRAQGGLWLLLSATGVILLVATTNAMTQNVPPVPFLWVLPLSLYLFSFVVCFHHPRWYVRTYWFIIFALCALMALVMTFVGSQFDIVTQIVIYSGILFAGCMICHGELAHQKPSTEHLTWYYLIMSLGGFAGSAFVAFGAVKLFSQYTEYPLAIIVVLLLFSLSLYQQYQLAKSKGLVVASTVYSAVLVTLFYFVNQQYVKTNVMSERNFYGIISVKDVITAEINERRLIDGTTSHGTQSLIPERENIPLSYYREQTGVAIAFSQLRKQGAIRAGFIGLGAGTLAAYGKDNDYFKFYELNPAVINAAQTYFTYLSKSKATIDIVAGDGRVSLTNELNHGQPQAFDILVVDAFSGDSIPQHLLTKEAIALYFQHLNKDGIIAVHISNSHLNLTGLLKGLAQESDSYWQYFFTQGQNKYQHDTQWVWLTKQTQHLNSSVVKAYQSNHLIAEEPLVLWTDNFSHLISVLK